MGYVDVVVKPVLKRNPKVKPLVAAILAEAARQGATVWEFEKACDLAKEMIHNEIAVSSMVINEFASSAQAALDTL